VQALRQGAAFATVVYCGDGANDLCPALALGPEVPPRRRRMPAPRRRRMTQRTHCRPWGAPGCTCASWQLCLVLQDHVVARAGFALEKLIERRADGKSGPHVEAQARPVAPSMHALCTACWETQVAFASIHSALALSSSPVPVMQVHIWRDHAEMFRIVEGLMGWCGRPQGHLPGF
jgi:Putative Phosphatase